MHLKDFLRYYRSTAIQTLSMYIQIRSYIVYIYKDLWTINKLIKKIKQRDFLLDHK